MTDDRPKSMTADVSDAILRQMEAVRIKWDRRGYCSCCVARVMLMHAGLLASWELTPGDLCEVLDHIGEQCGQHAAPDMPRH